MFDKLVLPLGGNEILRDEGRFAVTIRQGTQGGGVDSCGCHRNSTPPKKWSKKSRCFLYCFLLTV